MDANCECVYYDQEGREKKEEREKDAAVVLNPQGEMAMVGVWSEKGI